MLAKTEVSMLARAKHLFFYLTAALLLYPACWFFAYTLYYALAYERIDYRYLISDFKAALPGGRGLEGPATTIWWSFIFFVLGLAPTVWLVRRWLRRAPRQTAS